MTNSALKTRPECDDPRQGGGMLGVDEAMRLAVSLVAPRGDPEPVALGDAAGRVLAEDVRAPRPMPLFDNSAMDGFAVSTRDLEGEGPWVLPVLATVAAGAPAGRTFDRRTRGVCRIFTGAPVPQGYDAVVMQEECGVHGGAVLITRRPAPGENLRRTGGDIAPGETLACHGTRLQPRHIGCLAANGFAEVRVHRRPRVGIFSTGDELLRTALPARQGCIPDANRPMLLALARSLGAEATDLGILGDDLEETTRFLKASEGRFDLIVSSGAVSVGGRDFLRPAFGAAGGTVEHWRVAMKPGKPVLFGQLGATAYVGLPGNPLAAYVGFKLFVSRQVAKLSRRPVGQGLGEQRAVISADIRSKQGLAEFFPARIVGHLPAQTPVLERLGRGSASLFPLCLADGLACVAEGQVDVRAGDTVAWLPFLGSPEEGPR